jgi:hypothetical protein
VEQAAQAGEATVLSVPLGAHNALPAELLHGRTVLDTGNYYPSRDGRIAELDSDEISTSELAQRLLPGALLVTAFNNILAHHVPQLARPAGAPTAAHYPSPATNPTRKSAPRARFTNSPSTPSTPERSPKAGASNPSRPPTPEST